MKCSCQGLSPEVNVIQIVLFLIREPFTQLPSYENSFTSFESSSVTLKLPGSKISVFNVYRPPSSSHYSKPNSIFLMSLILSYHLPPLHLTNLSSQVISIFMSIAVPIILLLSFFHCSPRSTLLSMYTFQLTKTTTLLT